MAGLKGIDDSIAFSIAQNCKSVIHVSFKNCELTDAGVCEIATNCSKLSVLALSGMADLTDRSIFALAENCHEMRDLFVAGCPKITRQAITYLKVKLLRAGGWYMYVPEIFFKSLIVRLRVKV